MNVLDEIEAELKRGSIGSPHKIDHVPLAALCKYVRAAEAQVRVMRGPFLVEFQSARRGLGLEGKE